MTKVKNLEKSATSTGKSNKKELTKVTSSKSLKKPTTKKFKYRTYVKRLCKSLNIPIVNKDGSRFIDESIQKFVDGVIRHSAVMLSNTNRSFSQKTARLVFTAYMETLGAPDDLLKGALKKADASIELLGKK